MAIVFLWFGAFIASIIPWIISKKVRLYMIKQTLIPWDRGSDLLPGEKDTTAVLAAQLSGGRSCIRSCILPHVR